MYADYDDLTLTYGSFYCLFKFFDAEFFHNFTVWQN